MATDSSITTRHFAAACGLLRQYAATAAPFVPQPGTSVVQDGAAGNNATQQQLTIFYGGTVVVLDGCTPDKAAELMRLAAAAAGQGGAAPKPPTPSLVDIPIARNASLRRFLAKRKDRATAPDSQPPVPPFERKEQQEPELLPAAKKARLEEAASWLALGTGNSLWDPCTRAERRWL